jgi:hypothetical protein
MAFGDNKPNYSGGMETAVEDAQFVDKILEVSKNVSEAIRRTKFPDDRTLLNAVKLRDWLVSANKTGKLNFALETLKFFLDGQLSVGGYNFALAIMGHSKIPVPSAMGVHLSKEDTKAFEDITKSREKMREKRNEEQSD